MPLITFVNADGSSKEVEAKVGDSVMQAAVDNGVDAIVAECGGACSCATCHCYIDAAWKDKFPAADDMEEAMLECVLEPQDSSRLSCQLTVREEHDGLIVNLPADQY